MYGYKFLRPDLQEKLVRRARHEGIVHTIDRDGFVVVHSKDEHKRLERIDVEIGTGALGLGRLQCTWVSTESAEWYREKAGQARQLGISIVEYETISDPPQDWLRRPDAPTVWHVYGMIRPKTVER
jgi:hypothetical protein